MDLEIGDKVYYKLDMRPVIVIDTSSLPKAKVTVRYLGEVSGLYHAMLVHVNELTEGHDLELDAKADAGKAFCDGCGSKFPMSEMSELDEILLCEGCFKVGR